MKDHEIILKMIEEVDPNDTAKLDEIDARVSAYNMGLHALRWEKRGVLSVQHKGEECVVKPSLKYTRSRDALKAIRPRGWLIGSISQDGDGWHCHLYLNYDTHGVSYGNKTEELAELHTIIQAIAYEREMK